MQSNKTLEDTTRKSETNSLYNHPGSVRNVRTKKKMHFIKTGPKDTSFDSLIHRKLYRDPLFTQKGADKFFKWNPLLGPKDFPPYKYPEELNQFALKVVHRNFQEQLQEIELMKPYYAKGNATSRINEDLLERIYVADPPPVSGLKTVSRIDPEFFSIVEGRPIHKPFAMTTYLDNIRKVLRTKLMVGYRHDEMLLIDEKLKREKLSIEKIMEKYNEYMNLFEAFLSADYNESMRLLRTAEKTAMQNVEKGKLVRELYIANSAIEFAVHKLEERWRDLKMYQKFLYFVSPISWRLLYDYIHKDDFDSETSSIFKKYVLGAGGQFPSLTNLVDEYLETIKNEEEPRLYFTAPIQLVKVFRFIEIQNLNCLLHTEEIQVPMENMRATMEEARKSFTRETTHIENLIKHLKEGIEWEETCSADLQSLASKHVNGIFRKLVADDKILKLHVYIEDVYEATIYKNDSELNMHDMMVAIEQTYNNLVLKLDSIPEQIVHSAERIRFAEQKRLAKLCRETAQKIALVDSITWRLKKSLEPPYKKKRDCKWRSTPPDIKEPPPAKPRKLTYKENEYLSYFTVYCAHTDSVEEYGIDLKVPETDFSSFSIVLMDEEESTFQLNL